MKTLDSILVFSMFAGIVGFGIGLYEFNKAYQIFSDAYRLTGSSSISNDLIYLLSQYSGNMKGLFEYVKSVSPEAITHFYIGLTSLVTGAISSVFAYSTNLLLRVTPQSKRNFN